MSDWLLVSLKPQLSIRVVSELGVFAWGMEGLGARRVLE